MRKIAATPTALEREWAYFLWALFATAAVRFALMKLAE